MFGGEGARRASTYMYFIRTSNASVPPGALYNRLSIGDMSDCRIDWRISITVARYASYVTARQVSLLLCNANWTKATLDLVVVGSPSLPRACRRTFPLSSAP